MNKLEFGEVVANKLNELYGEGYDAKAINVQKDNGVERVGIILRKDNENSAPTIYIDDFYSEYISMETTVHKTALFLKENFDSFPKPDLDVDGFLDYNNVKSKLAFKISDPDIDKSDFPCVEKDGFKVFAYVEIVKNEEGSAVFQIKEEHLKRWNVSIEQVVEDAFNNVDINSYQLVDLEAIILGDVMGMSLETKNHFKSNEKLDAQMYFLSNEEKHYGAGAILVPEVREKVSELIGGDYFILPSSKHEVIILPTSISNTLSQSVSDLQEMVKTVNMNEVDEVDRLSDKCFRYDSKTKTIVDALEYEKDIQITKSVEIATLATELDEFAYGYDPYNYADSVGFDVEDRTNGVTSLAMSIKNGETDGIKNYLNDIIFETEDVLEKAKAQELVDKLEKLSSKNQEDINNAKHKTI